MTNLLSSPLRCGKGLVGRRFPPSFTTGKSLRPGANRLVSTLSDGDFLLTKYFFSLSPLTWVIPKKAEFKWIVSSVKGDTTLSLLRYSTIFMTWTTRRYCTFQLVRLYFTQGRLSSLQESQLSKPSVLDVVFRIQCLFIECI